jgi:hypothetical protein
MERYIPTEFPKWVGGALVRSAAEERDRRAALEDAAATASAAELLRPPSLASMRMRRSRERRREGKLSIRFDISSAQIEALVSAGLIDPARQDDAVEVALGVVRLMDHLTESDLIVTQVPKPVCCC